MEGLPQILIVVASAIVPVCFCLNIWPHWQLLVAGQPLIPYRHRSTVGWGLLDLALFIITMAAVTSWAAHLAADRMGVQFTEIEDLPPTEQSTVIFAYSVASLITTLMCLSWNWSRFGSIQGFDRWTIGADVQLGFTWFTMLVVPVLLLQAILTQWFPSQHPLVEMLQESGDTSFLPSAAFAALISAPIFEECFFRLFLQGWLEKLQITQLRNARGLATKADRDAVLLGGSTSSTFVRESYDDHAADPSPVSADAVSAQPREEVDSVGRHIMWPPILASASVFALAHWAHGPDWVPLFLLSLGLGYLYQRTGRIVPCIVAHFLVNSIGILMLWSSITAGSPIE